jgi:hypothetical protein
MKLKNIDGTSGNKCGCGSWLDHWARLSGQTIPKYCVVSNCCERQLVGAHVQKDSYTDRNWYIVPLCAKHNAKAESLDVPDWVTLVSANVSETCDKGKYEGLLGNLGVSYPLRR